MKLQEWIHQLEVGAGTRYVRLAVVLFGFMALALLYNLFEYKNLAHREAMDAAQLARNVAEGRGFTTQCVRPLSLHLVEAHQRNRGVRTNDFSMIDEGHPDLANPPLYPLLLAGAMRVLPFKYDIPGGRQYRHYQPDLMIALINQALLLVLAILTFRLALQLFDRTVAWGAVIAVVGSEWLWRFTVSGLPTLLMMNLGVLLVMCLAELERRARTTEEPPRSLIPLAIAAGLLIGLGALTRYAYGWLILPTLLFLVAFLPRNQKLVPGVVLVTFLVVLTPWLARNYHLSGTAFGTAGYAAMADIYPMKSSDIERSLERPSTEDSLADAAVRKFLVNAPGLLQVHIFTSGGGWFSAFFLVGLLVPFADPGRNRLRWFVVAVGGVLVVVQALTQVDQHDPSPVNAQNLLILLTPVICIFGMALFATLLDQLPLTFFRAREIMTAIFLGLICLPLVLTLLPPRRNVHAFPPYHPLYIQTMCNWMEKDELMMSDLPWATAWYGNRQCVWLSLKLADARHQNDFYAINDLYRRVHAVHITHQTLDQPMMTGLYANQERGSWEHLAFGLLHAHSEISSRLTPENIESGIPEKLQAQIVAYWRKIFSDLAPGGFPLQQSPLTFIPAGQLFLTDRVRWMAQNR